MDIRELNAKLNRHKPVNDSIISKSYLIIGEDDNTSIKIEVRAEDENAARSRFNEFYPTYQIKVLELIHA